ncbi:MAG: 30S ribosomal protein S9 [Spartobacteria bacterium]|nr:30S ribosomal protein S9 [Spartobacteria bacterium]
MALKVVEFAATGRRKEAVARVRMVPGSGKVTVNGRPFEDYFKTLTLRVYIVRPFVLVGMENKYDMVISTSGGGLKGQAGAVRHAISRALVNMDDTTRPVLKENGFLTRDSRMKERKKPGQPGARKRFQFSKR